MINEASGTKTIKTLGLFYLHGSWTPPCLAQYMGCMQAWNAAFRYLNREMQTIHFHIAEIQKLLYYVIAWLRVWHYGVGGEYMAASYKEVLLLSILKNE